MHEKIMAIINDVVLKINNEASDNKNETGIKIPNIASIL
jgi:hypothetical protein